MKHRATIVVLTLAMGLLDSVSQAGTITTFNDRATFNAAVGPTTTDTFGSVVAFPISTGVLDSSTSLVTSSGGPISPGLVQKGVTYSTPIGPSTFFFTLNTLGETPTDAFLQGGTRDDNPLGTPFGLNPLTVAFDNPISGFGFDSIFLGGPSVDVTIRFSSGSTQSFSSVQTAFVQSAFLGFQSSAADIISATILSRGGSADFAVDNFSVAGHPVGRGTVPEPITEHLLMLGFVCFVIPRAALRFSRACT